MNHALAIQATCLDIEMALKEYFSLNDPAHTSPLCTWAAHKARFRGILIQTADRYKRHYGALLKQKEDDLAAILKEHKRNPQLNLRSQIEAARVEVNKSRETITLDTGSTQVHRPGSTPKWTNQVNSW